MEAEQLAQALEDIQGLSAIDGTAVDRAAKMLRELTNLREAVGMAYGYLWCVNNEPGTPAALYPPERAAYAARKMLRDTMTRDERGVFINRVVPIVRGDLLCGCRQGECESKPGKRCRVADEIGTSAQ